MDEERVTSKSVITNFLWRFAERCGAQGVSFVVSIILARLLLPEDYGNIALITVFTAILNVFVDSGLGNALVQKKDADDLDFSSVFYFNIVMCLFLYGVMFFAAPYIARFYNNEELTPLVRAISLTLVLSGVKNVQQAYVSKKMIFKKFFFSTLGGTILSAVVGIAMAYAGFGVWAIVAQSLSNSFVDMLILGFTVKWRPKWMFSFKRLKGLLSYGWKLLVSNLIDTGYGNLRNLIIGKLYTSADLAYFNKAQNLSNLVINNVNATINSVLFPAMSQAQNDKLAVKNMTRRAITISTYIIFPAMTGLAVVGEPLVSLLLTDKWLPCVPYLRIYCFSYALLPIHTANLQAIKALGHSGIFLKLEIIKKVMALVVLIISMQFGVYWIAFSMIITSIVSSFINAFPNKKLLNYSYLEQVKDMLPGLILSAVMGAAVYLINYIAINNVFKLIIQVVSGVIIYFGLSALFKLESFNYCLNMVKPYLSKILNKKRSA